MSKIESMIDNYLKRIRDRHPDAKTVQREHDKAHREYMCSVLNGDGSGASGSIIIAHYAEREAWATYAKENGIDLGVQQ
ncbi:MAG: hypothetical protein IJ428_01210 [Clostridia bacterium]|nr:hypothetical protein [Clostridia bacterium]